MAKYLLRIQARQLRQRGISVKQIARELNVSKSTASLWVRDIILSIEQLEVLKKASIAGAEKGRLKGALIQKERRLRDLTEYQKTGTVIIGNLSERELLIAGLALYWGEGSKKTKEVQFCNSDPQMLVFLINWLKKCFSIGKEDLRCKVGVNEIHKNREEKIKKYWSEITGLPLNQFTRTSFKKVINKKRYANFDEHYGTLSIKVRQPSRFYGKIMGLIEGLAQAKVAQW